MANYSSRKPQTGQTSENNTNPEFNSYTDAMDITNYFKILWKRKWFIILLSVLPALAVGLNLFYKAVNYKTSFTYNLYLNERNLKVLGDIFYSEENMDRLSKKLQTSGFDALKHIVSFEMSPILEGSGEIYDTDDNYLSVYLTLSSKANEREAAIIFRENIENVVPLYFERLQLRQNITKVKNAMAAIERTRYTFNQALERKKDTLDKLNQLDSNGLNKMVDGNIVLQFDDIPNSYKYLPLQYQKQTFQMQVINLEEQSKGNDKFYEYNSNLLKLNQKLLDRVDKAINANSSLEQFCLSLSDVSAEYKDNVQTVDYLNAYIKGVENKVFNNKPIVEKPRVSAVAKGIKKKTAIVFTLSLAFSVFAAFLWEELENRKVKIS